MGNMKFCCFNEGKHKLHAVVDLYRELFNGVEPKTGLPHKGPILYRWWFPEESEPVKILRAYEAEDLLSKTLTATIGETKYYALYLGKGINGRRRLKNHISPRKRTSTLRRTLSGLLNTDDEETISKVLQQCYYEWCEMACSKDELSDREEQAIKDGYYPLNLSENEHISATWRLFLKNQRKSAETSNRECKRIAQTREIIVQ